MPNSPQWKSDNFCDDGNNHAGCNYDGGACCGGSEAFCSECECKKPIGLSPQCIACMDELCPEIIYGEWETCIICVFECVPVS